MSIRFLKLSLASPESIKSWTERRLPNGKRVGKILKGDLIDYKNGLPIRDGLSCERIFGPMVSFTCTCGRFKCIETRGIHIVHDTLRSSRPIMSDISGQNRSFREEQWDPFETRFKIDPIVSQKSSKKVDNSKPSKKLLKNSKADKSSVLQPSISRQKKNIRFLADFYYDYKSIYHFNKNEIIPSFVSRFEEYNLTTKKFKTKTLWSDKKKNFVFSSFFFPVNNKPVLKFKNRKPNLLKLLYTFVFQIYSEFWFDLKVYYNNFVYEKHVFLWVPNQNQKFMRFPKIHKNSFYSKLILQGLSNKSPTLPIISGILPDFGKRVKPFESFFKTEPTHLKHGAFLGDLLVKFYKYQTWNLISKTKYPLKNGFFSFNESHIKGVASGFFQKKQWPIGFSTRPFGYSNYMLETNKNPVFCLKKNTNGFSVSQKWLTEKAKNIIFWSQQTSKIECGRIWQFYRSLKSKRTQNESHFKWLIALYFAKPTKLNNKASLVKPAGFLQTDYCFKKSTFNRLNQKTQTVFENQNPQVSFLFQNNTHDVSFLTQEHLILNNHWKSWHGTAKSKNSNVSFGSLKIACFDLKQEDLNGFHTFTFQKWNRHPSSIWKLSKFHQKLLKPVSIFDGFPKPKNVKNSNYNSRSTIGYVFSNSVDRFLFSDSKNLVAKIYQKKTLKQLKHSWSTGFQIPENFSHKEKNHRFAKKNTNSKNHSENSKPSLNSNLKQNTRVYKFKNFPPEEIRYCPYCEVELLPNSIRRYRLGYIEFISPVTHIWYTASSIPLLLNLSKTMIEGIASCHEALSSGFPPVYKWSYNGESPISWTFQMQPLKLPINLVPKVKTTPIAKKYLCTEIIFSNNYNYQNYKRLKIETPSFIIIPNEPINNFTVYEKRRKTFKNTETNRNQINLKPKRQLLYYNNKDWFLNSPINTALPNNNEKEKNHRFAKKTVNKASFLNCPNFFYKFKGLSRFLYLFKNSLPPLVLPHFGFYNPKDTRMQQPAYENFITNGHLDNHNFLNQKKPFSFIGLNKYHDFNGFFWKHKHSLLFNYSIFNFSIKSKIIKNNLQATAFKILNHSMREFSFLDQIAKKLDPSIATQYEKKRKWLKQAFFKDPSNKQLSDTSRFENLNIDEKITIKPSKTIQEDAFHQQYIRFWNQITEKKENISLHHSLPLVVPFFGKNYDNRKFQTNYPNHEHFQIHPLKSIIDIFTTQHIWGHSSFDWNYNKPEPTHALNLNLPNSIWNKNNVCVNYNSSLTYVRKEIPNSLYNLKQNLQATTFIKNPNSLKPLTMNRSLRLLDEPSKKISFQLNRSYIINNNWFSKTYPFLPFSSSEFLRLLPSPSWNGYKNLMCFVLKNGLNNLNTKVDPRENYDYLQKIRLNIISTQFNFTNYPNQDENENRFRKLGLNAYYFKLEHMTRLENAFLKKAFYRNKFFKTSVLKSNILIVSFIESTFYHLNNTNKIFKGFKGVLKARPITFNQLKTKPLNMVSPSCLQTNNTQERFENVPTVLETVAIVKPRKALKNCFIGYSHFLSTRLDRDQNPGGPVLNLSNYKFETGDNLFWFGFKDNIYLAKRWFFEYEKIKIQYFVSSNFRYVFLDSKKHKMFQAIKINSLMNSGLTRFIKSTKINALAFSKKNHRFAKNSLWPLKSNTKNCHQILYIYNFDNGLSKHIKNSHRLWVYGKNTFKNNFLNPVKPIIINFQTLSKNQNVFYILPYHWFSSFGVFKPQQNTINSKVNVFGLKHETKNAVHTLMNFQSMKPSKIIGFEKSFGWPFKPLENLVKSQPFNVFKQNDFAFSQLVGTPISMVYDFIISQDSDLIKSPLFETKLLKNKSQWPKTLETLGIKKRLDYEKNLTLKPFKNVPTTFKVSGSHFICDNFKIMVFMNFKKRFHYKNNVFGNCLKTNFEKSKKRLHKKYIIFLKAWLLLKQMVNNQPPTYLTSVKHGGLFSNVINLLKLRRPEANKQNTILNSLNTSQIEFFGCLKIYAKRRFLKVWQISNQNYEMVDVNLPGVLKTENLEISNQKYTNTSVFPKFETNGYSGFPHYNFQLKQNQKSDACFFNIKHSVRLAYKSKQAYSFFPNIIKYKLLKITNKQITLKNSVCPRFLNTRLDRDQNSGGPVLKVKNQRLETRVFMKKKRFAWSVNEDTYSINPSRISKLLIEPQTLNHLKRFIIKRHKNMICSAYAIEIIQNEKKCVSAAHSLWNKKKIRETRLQKISLSSKISCFGYFNNSVMDSLNKVIIQKNYTNQLKLVQTIQKQIPLLISQTAFNNHITLNTIRTPIFQWGKRGHIFDVDQNKVTYELGFLKPNQTKNGFHSFLDNHKKNLTPKPFKNVPTTLKKENPTKSDFHPSINQKPKNSYKNTNYYACLCQITSWGSDHGSWILFLKYIRATIYQGDELLPCYFNKKLFQMMPRTGSIMLQQLLSELTLSPKTLEPEQNTEQSVTNKKPNNRATVKRLKTKNRLNLQFFHYNSKFSVFPNANGVKGTSKGKIKCPSLFKPINNQRFLSKHYTCFHQKNSSVYTFKQNKRFPKRFCYENIYTNVSTFDLAFPLGVQKMRTPVGSFPVFGENTNNLFTNNHELYAYKIKKPVSYKRFKQIYELNGFKSINNWYRLNNFFSYSQIIDKIKDENSHLEISPPSYKPASYRSPSYRRKNPLNHVCLQTRIIQKKASVFQTKAHGVLFDNISMRRETTHLKLDHVFWALKANVGITSRYKTSYQNKHICFHFNHSTPYYFLKKPPFNMFKGEAITLNHDNRNKTMLDNDVRLLKLINCLIVSFQLQFLCINQRAQQKYNMSQNNKKPTGQRLFNTSLDTSLTFSNPIQRLEVVSRSMPLNVSNKIPFFYNKKTNAAVLLESKNGILMDKHPTYKISNTYYHLYFNSNDWKQCLGSIKNLSNKENFITKNTKSFSNQNYLENFYFSNQKTTIYNVLISPLNVPTSRFLNFGFPTTPWDFIEQSSNRDFLKSQNYQKYQSVVSSFVSYDSKSNLWGRIPKWSYVKNLNHSISDIKHYAINNYNNQKNPVSPRFLNMGLDRDQNVSGPVLNVQNRFEMRMFFLKNASTFVNLASSFGVNKTGMQVKKTFQLFEKVSKHHFQIKLRNPLKKIENGSKINILPIHLETYKAQIQGETLFIKLKQIENYNVFIKNKNTIFKSLILKMNSSLRPLLSLSFQTKLTRVLKKNYVRQKRLVSLLNTNIPQFCFKRFVNKASVRPKTGKNGFFNQKYTTNLEFFKIWLFIDSVHCSHLNNFHNFQNKHIDSSLMNSNNHGFFKILQFYEYRKNFLLKKIFKQRVCLTQYSRTHLSKTPSSLTKITGFEKNSTLFYDNQKARGRIFNMKTAFWRCFTKTVLNSYTLLKLSNLEECDLNVKYEFKPFGFFIKPSFPSSDSKTLLPVLREGLKSFKRQNFDFKNTKIQRFKNQTRFRLLSVPKIYDLKHQNDSLNMIQNQVPINILGPLFFSSQIKLFQNIFPFLTHAKNTDINFKNNHLKSNNNLNTTASLNFYGLVFNSNWFTHQNTPTTNNGFKLKAYRDLNPNPPLLSKTVFRKENLKVSSSYRELFQKAKILEDYPASNYDPLINYNFTSLRLLKDGFPSFNNLQKVIGPRFQKLNGLNEKPLYHVWGISKVSRFKSEVPNKQNINTARVPSKTLFKLLWDVNQNTFKNLMPLNFSSTDNRLKTNNIGDRFETKTRANLNDNFFLDKKNKHTERKIMAQIKNIYPPTSSKDKALTAPNFAFNRKNLSNRASDRLKSNVFNYKRNVRKSRLQYLRTFRRLRFVEYLKATYIKPEWMILSLLPVLPPDLRPVIANPRGYITGDLNTHYQNVIYRNNNIERLLDAFWIPRKIYSKISFSNRQKATALLLSSIKSYFYTVDNLAFAYGLQGLQEAQSAFGSDSSNVAKAWNQKKNSRFNHHPISKLYELMCLFPLTFLQETIRKNQTLKENYEFRTINLRIREPKPIDRSILVQNTILRPTNYLLSKTQTLKEKSRFNRLMNRYYYFHTRFKTFQKCLKQRPITFNRLKRNTYNELSNNNYDLNLKNYLNKTNWKLERMISPMFFKFTKIGFDFVSAFSPTRLKLRNLIEPDASKQNTNALVLNKIPYQPNLKQPQFSNIYKTNFEIMDSPSYLDRRFLSTRFDHDTNLDVSILNVQNQRFQTQVSKNQERNNLEWNITKNFQEYHLKKPGFQPLSYNIHYKSLLKLYGNKSFFGSNIGIATGYNEIVQAFCVLNSKVSPQLTNIPSLETKTLRTQALHDSKPLQEMQYSLQKAVDALIDNSQKLQSNVLLRKGRPLKSLSDNLKGKEGRFRQHLLGKRVDYSGRSVIVVGPDLKLYECGIPLIMALRLFQPFLILYLIYRFKIASLLATQLIQRKHPMVINLLKKFIETWPILLNRAPTLHRMNIQAFKIRLVQGKAILLHPLVCSSYNADFDGDQMGVHVPITQQARAESWKLLWSINNSIAIASRQPLFLPSQDMVIGNYYLTAPPIENRLKQFEEPIELSYFAQPWSKGFQKNNYYFFSIEEAYQYYLNTCFHVNTPVWFRFARFFETSEREKPIEITLDKNGNTIYTAKYYEKTLKNNRILGKNAFRFTKNSYSINQYRLERKSLKKPEISNHSQVKSSKIVFNGSLSPILLNQIIRSTFGRIEFYYEAVYASRSKL